MTTAVRKEIKKAGPRADEGRPVVAARLSFPDAVGGKGRFQPCPERLSPVVGNDVRGDQLGEFLLNCQTGESYTTGGSVSSAPNTKALTRLRSFMYHKKVFNIIIFLLQH